MYIFILPNKDSRPGVRFVDRAWELDYLGAILIIGASVSGVMAVSFGGIEYLWNSEELSASLSVRASCLYRLVYSRALLSSLLSTVVFSLSSSSRIGQF